MALKPYLATASLPTKSASAGGGAEAAESARERREYIESQTRRVLERRGVDVRNGAAVEGRRMGGEEVRALEEIVAAMGGRNGEREEAGDEGDRMDTGD